MSMSVKATGGIRSPIKHLMRQMATYTHPTLGYQSGPDLDYDIGSLLLQGYRLVDTHYLGMQKDDAGTPYYGILYILQLEPSAIEKMRAEAAEMLKDKKD